MCEDESLDKIIRWSSNNDSFLVNANTEFTGKVLSYV